MKASETQDRFKRFEDVEAIKGTNLEIEERDKIVVHNGSPFLPTSTDGAAKACETPTSTDAAVKAFETKDLVKRFEDVEAVKGTNLEIEERDRIVVHNGSPFLPTSTAQP